jgi:hypothetical protein
MVLCLDLAIIVYVIIPYTLVSGLMDDTSPFPTRLVPDGLREGGFQKHRDVD